MSVRFCNYIIQEELGRGGMAVVYRAINSRGDPVALKVMHPGKAADPNMRRRFIKESRLRLVHPSIIQILDSGECGETPYFVMPLIEGRPLDKVLKGAQKLTLPELLPLLKDVAAGLDYAHAQGIIHRDIKPSNILIHAGDNRAIVTDFGVAKDTEATWSSTLIGTQTGVRVGTPQYMSPEQARGDPMLTRHSDVYSLGALVYRALCGRVPFDAPDDLAVLRMHLQDQPPDMRKLSPSISSAVAGVVMQALNKDPARRYDTASAFVQALEAASNVSPISKLWIGVMSGVATVVMGGLFLTTCSSPQPGSTPTPALAASIASAPLKSGATATPAATPMASTPTLVPSPGPTTSPLTTSTLTPTPTPKGAIPPTPPPPPKGKVARITYPPSGWILADEWVNIYGQASCDPAQIEYWKFEFDNGGFIARFEPGMFSGNLLMHWKVASITALIGNNQTRDVRLVVVCKDGNVVTSPSMRYTFRQ